MGCLCTNLPPFEYQGGKKKTADRRVSEAYGVTNYGSGWKKDVVNQCLEFAADPVKFVTFVF